MTLRFTEGRAGRVPEYAIDARRAGVTKRRSRAREAAAAIRREDGRGLGIALVIDTEAALRAKTSHSARYEYDRFIW